MLPTTHFAPKPHKLSAGSMLASTPLISVTALAGVSNLVRGAFGERVLRGANHAAMLDVEAIEDQNCFIPHITMATFVDAVAKLSGEEHFGLIVAPHLTIASKGCWGEYMLGAPTLGTAIRRGIATIGFHSRGDVMSLAVDNGEARLSYGSAAKGRDGYVHVAIGTAGILLSICRAFLPEPWRPLRIELDIARPRNTAAFEDVFGCPVVFDAPGTSICLDAALLRSRLASGGTLPPITVEDIARARVECGKLGDFREVIAEQVWCQVLTGQVSIESAACAVDTSVRTLQRELNREGTSFRALVNAMRTKRAAALLRETNASVTEVSSMLGYSSPAHFARAFRHETGISPNEFRRHILLEIAAYPADRPRRPARTVRA
jgi:AraC-like DNA-binding protein